MLVLFTLQVHMFVEARVASRATPIVTSRGPPERIDSSRLQPADVWCFLEPIQGLWVIIVAS